MNEPPAAITDWETYHFVSYSHLDASAVYEEIVWLQERGFRIYYDEGIGPGSTWSDAIAERIQRCNRFVYFVSPNSLLSEHCRRELNFALEEEVDVFAVHLVQCKIPPGVRLSLNNRQAIHKYALSESRYRQKLEQALRTSRESHGFLAPQRHQPDDRIHISVSFPDGVQAQPANDLIATIVRYLSWQGGIYRAHDDRSADSGIRHTRADYHIEVSTHLHRDAIRIDWQVKRPESGEIVWSSWSETQKDRFEDRKHRLAESIAEGALKMISNHEYRLVSGQPHTTLGYSQLILIAEQLNYLDRHELSTRINALERAMQLEPQSGLPHACLAGLLSWQIINGIGGDLESTDSRLMNEARTALKLDGNDPAVLLSVGTTYARIGRYDSGLSLIRRSHRMAPTMAAKDQLARSLCFAGQPEEAIDLFQDICQAMPDGHSFPYVRLAIAQAQAGKLEEALENAIESTVLFPNDYYGWFVLANLFEQLNRSEEARNAVREGQRLAPNLKIRTVIANTESTYGRTEEQRHWLTAGLRRLVDESG